MKEWGYDGVEEGKVPLEQVEVGLTGDLTGTGGDDAEIGVGIITASDGRFSEGVDLGVLENTSSTFVLDAEEVKGTVQSSKKNSP
ncbi:hypothetical protein LR48_Vigan10g170600 [Vigna angularis]|uniref:Uncharacterized protein n=1 Tax=Phaseolus angularis TaxID=3914 RepID=A0A0L9VM38_PHAAN|nr:hypothetical protein LR48_Vigan10g170600 [Vigna angularis]